jgi:outer membrane receptor protein involved in Fe transport
MKHELPFRLSLLFAALSLALLSAAQTLTLRGRITDGANDPVIGASVLLKGTGRSTTSDVTGSYIIAGLKHGSITLQVAFIGFTPQEKTIVLKADATIDFVLANGAIDLKEVSVSPRSDATLTETIGALDHDLRPVQTAQDLLKMVPGLFIAQHAGGGKAEQIFIRGFDCDHGTDLFISVDGMPVNMVSHAHGQGYADLHFVIPETVDRINVHKGPYTTRFGDFSTSGTVEFNTMDHIDQSLVKVEGGMFNTRRGVAVIDLLGKRHLFGKRPENLYVAGEYAFTDAYFKSKQDFNRANGLLKYSAQLSDRSHLAFSASSFGANWNASGQVPQRAIDDGSITRFGAIDNEEGGNTTRTNVNALLTTRLGNDAVLKNQIYYVKYDFNLFSDFTFFLEDSVHGDMINQRDDRNIGGYTGTYTQNALIGDIPLKWTAGLGARYDRSDIQLLHGEERVVRDTVRSGNLDQLNTSAYLDGTFDLSRKWSVNAGLRFDVYDLHYTEDRHDSLSGDRMLGRVSPKLNLYYQATEKTQFYVRSGVGFHSNDARSVVLSQAANSLPSAFGVDVGSTFKPAPRIIMNAALWGLLLESEIVYVGDGGTAEINTPTQRLGFDVGIRYQLNDHLYADADINYSHGTILDVPSEENRIPLAPQFTTIGGLAYKRDRGINATLRYRYIADRPANEMNTVVAKGYFLVDAGMSYRLAYWELGVSAENLLNTEWNQAQFDTESRLQNEAQPVSELHFTPGTPFFLKGIVSYRF